MMKKFNSKKLNIPRLLALGDLDVRGIAAANTELYAREYFSMVKWFIEDAPQYADELAQASDPDELERLKDVLSKIGYDKINADIDVMIKEIKAGNKKINNERVLREFNALQERLKDVYTSKNSRYSNIRAERFIEEAPQYLDELAHVSDPDRLEVLKSILSVIGYEKPNPDFENLIKASQIDEYYEKFKAAYMGINHEYAQAAKKTPQPEDSGASLAEALEYMDFEESHRKLRILAVDDVAAVLNAVASALSPYYEVYALTKASQVEKFLTHTTPELFLLDIEMPDLSGYDLVSVIRGFEEHKDTPIIFLTGSATLDNIKTAVSLGASDFITKPVDKDILLDKIKSKIVWKKAF